MLRREEMRRTVAGTVVPRLRNRASGDGSGARRWFVGRRTHQAHALIFQTAHRRRWRRRDSTQRMRRAEGDDAAEAAKYSFTHKISDVERLQFRSMTALAVSKAPRVLRATLFV